LHHQIGYRRLLCDLSQLVTESDDCNHEQDDEKVGTKYGESLNGRRTQVHIKSHIENPESHRGQKEQIDKPMQMLLPESLLDE
jgi:hypothetical protein